MPVASEAKFRVPVAAKPLATDVEAVARYSSWGGGIRGGNEFVAAFRCGTGMPDKAESTRPAVLRAERLPYAPAPVVAW